MQCHVSNFGVKYVKEKVEFVLIVNTGSQVSTIIYNMIKEADTGMVLNSTDIQRILESYEIQI